MKLNLLKSLKFALHGAFWFSYAVVLLAFFEQCLDNGSPIFSSVMGAPFLHHGYYGFIGMAIAYAAFMIVQIVRKQSSNFESIDRIISEPSTENICMCHSCQQKNNCDINRCDNECAKCFALDNNITGCIHHKGANLK
jgi:hypothetical protein